MKKYIFVLNAIELMNQLMNGKRVEGALYVDQNTGRLTFKAYNRQPRNRHERVVCQLENGWLKESPQRYKFFSSVKKALGRRMVDVVMHRELKSSMEVVEEEEILDRV
jgi:hypothetical protein